MAKTFSGILTRGLSALLLAAICLVVTAQGGLAFLVLILVFLTLVHWEWHSKASKARMVNLVPALLACFAAAYGIHTANLELAGLALIAAVLLGLGAGFLAGKGAVWTALGVLYVVLPALSFIDLRHDGFGVIAWLFLVIWMTDIGAYLVGSVVGGPKLWVRVSPGKTWSGAVGGSMLGTLCGVLLGSEWLDPSFGLVTTLVLALSLTIVGQLGDLAESAWKRHFNTKDSGRIIPGHGGVMDRVDSLLAGGVYLVGLKYLGGIGL